MKTSAKLAILSVIIVVLSGSIFYLTPKRNEINSAAEGFSNVIKSVQAGKCGWPTGTGYTICCLSNGTGSDCTTKTNFKCGDEIGVLFTINFSKPSYYCFNEDVIGPRDFGAPGVYFYDGNTKSFECNYGDRKSLAIYYSIPSSNGRITFAKLYVYEAGTNFSTPFEFYNNINSAKKLFDVNGDVTC